MAQEKPLFARIAIRNRKIEKEGKLLDGKDRF